MAEVSSPVVVLIFDGFGVAPPSSGNAITEAETPRLDALANDYPTMTLRASGEEVGLSWGEMGNSEVGHLAIGAGRVVRQMLPRINKAIESGVFFSNEAFLNAVTQVKNTGGTLHLAGLVSHGGVHSQQDHLYALLQLAKDHGVKDVAVHAFLDGRDAVYNSAADFIAELQGRMRKIGVGRIATLCGRYYAMDRDNRWDRTEKAYNAMVLGQGVVANDPLEAIRASYAKDVFDEEFVPTVLFDEGQPSAIIKDGDAVIFFNFRADRMRQMTKAFVLPEFEKFPRTRVAIYPVTMSEYERGLPVAVAFEPHTIERTLAQTIAEHGFTQLHIAETEKYAHITFFLNGTREEPFPGEDRLIIPSPNVAQYSEAPEMSIYPITEAVLKAIKKGSHDVIFVNFANADMVAHTGDFDATVKAVEAIDECTGKIADAILETEGTLFITADHGNAEEVHNVRTGEIDKEHATNPVPFIAVSKAYKGVAGPTGEVPNGDLSLLPPVGMLGDVAPTVLSVLGIPQPQEMTGSPLL